jgi:hypothetical protein
MAVKLILTIKWPIFLQRALARMDSFDKQLSEMVTDKDIYIDEIEIKKILPDTIYVQVTE